MASEQSDNKSDRGIDKSDRGIDKSPDSQKLTEYTDNKITEIVSICVESLYGGMKSNARRMKNQKPDSMKKKVLECEVSMVGLYCKLPVHLRELVYSNDSVSKRMLKMDEKVKREISDFILKYDGLYTKKYCCFMSDRARNALLQASKGEYTSFPLNFKAWFNVSERQLCGN